MLRPSTSYSCLLLAGAASAAIAVSGQAAPVVGFATDVAPNPGSGTYTPASFSASNSDLLQSATIVSSDPAADYVTTNEFGGGLPALTDGSIDTAYSSQPAATRRLGYAVFGNNNGGQEVVWQLDGTYDITGFTVYGGWGSNGRDEFSFTFKVSTDGINFTEIVGAAETLIDDNIADNVPITHRVTVTSDTAFLAEDITHISFNTVSEENGYIGISEIDLFGVPEPGSLALLGLSGLALAGRRRR